MMRDPKPGVRPGLRRIALLCGAAAVLASAALGSSSQPAHALDAPGSGFFGYTLLAQGSGMQMTEDEPSANSHPEADSEVPYSQVSLTSGPVGYALSSAAWPGALAANAGSLILLVNSGAPSQVKMLNDPVRAEARTGGETSTVTNDSVPGVTMTATVLPGKVSAASVIDGGQAGTTVGFGTTTSKSSAVLSAASATTTADSAVKDISLASGVVTIGSVVSHATGTTNGTVVSGAGRTVVTGLKVANVPVSVDDKGVTVASSSSPIDPVAVDTVNSALASMNLRIALSKPSSARSGGSISYDAGSLVVYWAPPGSSNVFTAALGGARVVAAATKSDLYGGNVPPAFPPVNPPVAVGPGTGGTGIGSAPLPPTQPVVNPPVNPPAVAAPGPATGSLLEPLASGTTAPALSVTLAVLGALLLLAGLWRAPFLVLVSPAAARCPLEEIP
jgi:hypothetical protein